MELFKRYRCKAYMRKADDGARIEIRDPNTLDLDKAKIVLGTYYEDGEAKVKDLSSCEGETIPKSYYERKETEFEGFLVGTKKINVRGVIGTDSDGDRRFFFKDITEKEEVGIVYFRNNGKRYVLLDDMEMME